MLSLALTFFVTTAPPAAPPPTKAATTTTTTTTTTKPTAPTTAAMVAVSDKDYEAIILAPRAGRVVVVNFWASYCLPCIEEIPALQELGREHAADVDVVFVSSDPPSQAPHALAILKRRKIEVSSYIVSNDEPEPFIQMINVLRCSGMGDWGGEMPFTVIYGSDGAVVQKMPGAHKKADFKAAIVAAVAAGQKRQP